jgi:2-keto-4-pentenoate hydratase/2-oxohepta-3-ene-1,7-dioic acid hydratase in catechol pathway
MRLASYEDATGRSFGIVTEGGIFELASRLGVRDLDAVLSEGLLDRAREFAGEAPDVHTYRLLKPLVRPAKCFCLGMNYPDRDGNAVIEPGRPSLFLRVADSFVGPQEAILRPPESTEFDYQGEVALVIGRAGRRIPRAVAMDHVAGYMLANDGSMRDWMYQGRFNVTQAKNFWRSGSLGPWITTRAAVGDGPFRVLVRVNGELRQDDNTARMVLPMEEIIAYISTFTPLAPGDVILTGTPTGTGASFDPPRWLEPNDIVEVEVSELGMLRNTMADEV